MTSDLATDDRALAAINPADLRTRSRADLVYRSLRDAIWEGRIGRGERLREEEIARTLGVSRTPVREALQRLQQRGLLVNRLGRGLTAAELSKREVIELYAMREILESSAARFAAQHATGPEIEILYGLQRELSAAPDEALRLVTLNRRFHQAIYDAAHNQYLTQALDALHDSMALLHATTFRAPQRRRESDEEHHRIVAAIERHNADEAEAAAREHIRQAQRTRFETLMR
ncbi:MAG TPA: GntR family transcriptional regulator [Xanthobacteraceae bacterium]|jgi:DNA-binding GntR family transcriptional regulator